MGDSGKADEDKSMHRTAMRGTNEAMALFAGAGMSALIAASQVWSYELPRMALLQVSYYAFAYSLALMFAPPVLLILGELIAKTVAAAQSKVVKEVSGFAGMMLAGAIMLAGGFQMYKSVSPLVTCGFGGHPTCNVQIK